MKVKDGFVMNKVGSQYVVVPVGAMSTERYCMIRLNATGAFLWERLKASCTADDLIAALLDEYEVTAETAAKDVAAFIDTLRGADLLDE